MKRSRKSKKISPETEGSENESLSSKASAKARTERSEEDPLRHKHHPAKGFDSVYYSREKRERGSGMQGGQGYSSRGGYGRRG